jgi:DnaJ-class molecular chaperone
VSELTVGFKRISCPDCEGSGELRIESENINEDFEVEKQTVITECPRCLGLGFMPHLSPRSHGRYDQGLPTCRKIAVCNQSSWKQEG